MIKGLFTKFWYFLVVLLVLGAVAMAAARMMAPLANEYRAKIEEFATRALGQPVKIAGFDAGWYLYGPHFALKDVRLLDQSSGQVLLRFDEARVGIDLLKSITNQRLEPSSIVIIGTGFTLIRHPGGRLSVLGFAAKQQKPAAADTARDKVTAWLLGQPYIAFDESRFTWRDLEKGDRSLHFSDVSLRLHNDGNRHVLNGSGLLPLSMGRRFDFAVDINGNPLSLDEWEGDIYVAGSGIQLRSWIPEHGFYQVGLASGTADLELWSHWKRSRMVSAEGRIGAYNLKMTSIGGQKGVSGSRPRSLTVDSASGRFLWQAREAGWRLDVDRFVLTRGERMWIPTRLALLVQKREQTEFRFASDRLQVDDLMDFIEFRRPLNDGLGDALLGIQPSGELLDVNLAYTSNGGFTLLCGFQGLSTRPWQKFPGISNFAGTLQSDANGGSLSINSSGAEINFENLLRDFVRVDGLSAHISWRRDENRNWSIDAQDLQFRNEDIQLAAEGRLLLPADHGSPELNLTAKFDKGDIGHASRYLPVSKMRPGLVHWLDQALVSGRLRDGSLLFSGRLKDFPFDHKEGRFSIHFGVQDTILEYAANWPRLEKLDGEVTFDGRTMKGLIASGESFDSTIVQSSVSIDNLAGKPPILSVDGKARGPTRDAMRYVQESPLNEHYGKYFENTEVTGASTLDLKIHLPLARDKTGTRVRGRLMMLDSTMLLAGGKVDIKKINGTLGFSQDGLSASGIKARILGLPGSIEIHNEMQGKNKLTVFSANGRAGSAEYATLVDLPQLFDRARGSTDWQAVLRLDAGGGEESDTTLTITSDLKGIAVNLPPPLGKNAMQSRKLVIDTALPRTDNTPTRIRYGDRFQAILAYREGPDGQRVDRGELRFGGRAASLPAGHGLRIAGEFDYFSLPRWQDFIDSFEPQPASASDAAGVKSLDIRIAHGHAYGRDWSAVELQGTRGPDAWQTQVTSKQLVGKIVVPHKESLALVMNLEKLVLKEQKSSGKEPKTDPRKLRPAKITSKHFIYKGADLGKLELEASRRQSGLHIDSLHLDSPTSDITARGDWVVVNNAHSSSFDIQIDTQDMGVLLANFGYPGNIDNGRGKISIIALWPGSPSDYAVEILEGTVAMHITDGRLLEIEPGAGRFFGLLSLQTLPRRLTLDFSDLFQKGFRFDQLSGEFSIKNGNAYTNNLFMEGPPARIEVIGRMGLAAEDFDERVTVTPHVTSSLPIAGAIAGGPGVGAAILFMQKILQPKIDRMTRYHYRVTGSWDNPVIEREPT